MSVHLGENPEVETGWGWSSWWS